MTEEAPRRRCLIVAASRHLDGALCELLLARLGRYAGALAMLFAAYELVRLAVTLVAR